MAPTIILVPGAWHVPEHYEPLTSLFAAAGYKVLSKRLPSVKPSDPKTATTSGDSAFVRNELIIPELDAGNDVVLVLHSYGGSPGSVAAKGLGKGESGKKGSVIGLVIMCGLVIPEGASLKGSLPTKEYDPWVMVDDATGIATPAGPENVFYNDVDEKQVQRATALLGEMAEISMSSPCGPPAWADASFDGRRGYIQCEQDNCVPFPAQDAMVTYSGVQWDVRKMNSGHSPFLSQPEKLAEHILEMARGFEAK